MEKIELRCLKCGEPLDVMPDVRNDETGLHQFVSPCNNCIGEELKFFRNSFPRAAANYFKVSAQQSVQRTDETCANCGRPLVNGVCNLCFAPQASDFVSR